MCIRDRFIFSSTAAVYGQPLTELIDETHPRSPVNTYGRTKVIIEDTLADYTRTYGLKTISLRYFNAAGSDPEGELGECHEPETHLIPLVIKAARSENPEAIIHGDDYHTPDGTCIRDYIHVNDLCRAHLLALEGLEKKRHRPAYNLGTGRGYSVREVIETVSNIMGKDILIKVAQRRPGDPPRLVADASAARHELDWVPESSNLETMVSHACHWQCRRPDT